MQHRRRNPEEEETQRGEVVYVDKKKKGWLKSLRSLLFLYVAETQGRLREYCYCFGSSMGLNGKGEKLGVYPSFMGWSIPYLIGAAKFHPLPVLLGGSLLFFMAVEYTLVMVSAGSEPYDVGFVWTQGLHDLLMQRPYLNSLLAAMNTAFVGLQTGYIIWTWLVEGRGRPTIAALFMFTCRGILGYSTQLPLPQDFLGSGVDFPVGNVSFFLFFSGHVAASVIASVDMKRMKRYHLASIFDTLNVLQSVRLLATRGHYTIDLAAGLGAGWLFDSLAGKYEESKRNLGQKEDLEYDPLINLQPTSIK
uniref:AtPDCT1/2 transmembrane domain-containing protein n=1 Tax=Araucaria cunninghamii TaxID=56994 RepID=A0A0D6R548_ARACU